LVVQAIVELKKAAYSLTGTRNTEKINAVFTMRACPPVEGHGDTSRKYQLFLNDS
jgi:hypothetical protein